MLRLPVFSSPRKRVAIVVPISTRPELTPGERISLRHLQHYLGRYDTYYLAPPDASPDLPSDATIIRFPAKYFGSNHAHSLMQLSAEFYEQFLDYEYILMYHLDALVFSDELKAWCEKGLDYIGAPWLNSEHTPWVQEPEVGNSGFALMNVRSFLRVLYSRKRRKTFSESRQKASDEGASVLSSLFNTVRSLRYLTPLGNDVKSHIKYLMQADQLSDLFWSRYAKHYDDGFKIGSVDEALTFAFEVNPDWCLEQTDGELPFGCHAWEKFDPAFWQPYLLPADQTE